jgi:D-alanyl-D-alanine-carboxypeptidase/D-alanyl-D-alanine-endopeptidase
LAQRRDRRIQCICIFDPKGDYGGLVLLNSTIGERGSFADRIGERISERLAGKPATSLGE